MKLDAGDIASFAAVVVSVASLGISIWFGQDARERDFLYKSYERLGQLATTIHTNTENFAQRLSDARRATSGEEATRQLAKFMIETVDEVTRAKQEIAIHQFAMDEATFATLNQQVNKVHELYNHWDEARKKQEATEEDIREYAEAVGRFWKQMNEAVSTSIAEIARQLRESV